MFSPDEAEDTAADNERRLPYLRDEQDERFHVRAVLTGRYEDYLGLRFEPDERRLLIEDCIQIILRVRGVPDEDDPVPDEDLVKRHESLKDQWDVDYMYILPLEPRAETELHLLRVMEAVPDSLQI